MKRLAFVICILFSLVVSVRAFQFEGKEWGTSKDKLFQQLKESGKSILDISIPLNQTLSYPDTLIDQPCMVHLVFTPTTKLLSGVLISWDDTLPGDNLKRLLIEKYGIPIRPNEFEEYYVWGNAKTSAITLSYTFLKTHVLYLDGGYETMRIKELKEIVEQESFKF